MNKKYSIFILFIFLNNCTTPGSAFLGPTFTGFKTGSVYQTSLSYGSSQSINHIKNSLKENKSNDLLVKVTSFPEMPSALISITTHDIKISEVFEEEPLP